MEEYDYVLKILLLGDSGVGKSSILLRFSEDQFYENQGATIGVDFKVKFMEVLGTKFKIAIWDTAGQERFRTITSSYYKDAQGTFLIFDISRRDTFQSLTRWISELKSNANNDDMVLILVGNKIDLESQRQVSKEEAQEFAESNNMMYVEASAKTAFSIENAFIELCKLIIHNKNLLESGSVNKRGQNLHSQQQDNEQAVCPC